MKMRESQDNINVNSFSGIPFESCISGIPPESYISGIPPES